MKKTKPRNKPTGRPKKEMTPTHRFNIQVDAVTLKGIDVLVASYPATNRKGMTEHLLKLAIQKEIIKPLPGAVD